MLGILSVLLIFCFAQTSKFQEIQVFDPFEILEIPKDAENRAIKKAFRKLSLMYHPDKNRHNPLPAAAKFQQITKAYEALTDELARSNWEKYGNPDGPGTMQVAIGLPKFLLESENSIGVLIGSFVMILVLIPGVFFWMYNKSHAKDEQKMIGNSANIYGSLLNENLLFFHIPKIISLTEGF